MSSCPINTRELNDEEMKEPFFKREKGILIVISGPSCAGKGSVCRIISRNNPDLRLSISETTRQPRNGEKHGRDYFFLTKTEFEERIKKGQYLEYASVYENYYGTPKDYVENLLESGYDVILEIDIQGAAKVRTGYKEGIYIFIVPPSMKELKRRIEERGTESKEQMEMRLSCASEEIKNADDYSYIVINDDLNVAANKVQSIITAEKCRTERLKNRIEEILGR
ncbi:MAG: guanylate kinase [Eubacteriaceae bacterium]|jgi:guanylate kinase|nr:guanylate kinase [Eubacteriaceae bacterium]MDK2904084.1 guanylate kinase [Eubacteriaceae bacterium]MDK2935788.1 guanylate kinase [Eubacteriaceae bacterium]MDK2961103.1 guanylate kinase [Eubacteriaceae bacterium]